MEIDSQPSRAIMLLISETIYRYFSNQSNNQNETIIFYGLTRHPSITMLQATAAVIVVRIVAGTIVVILDNRFADDAVTDEHLHNNCNVYD